MKFRERINLIKAGSFLRKYRKLVYDEEDEMDSLLNE